MTTEITVSAFLCATPLLPAIGIKSLAKCLAQSKRTLQYENGEQLSPFVSFPPFCVFHYVYVYFVY